MMRLFVEQYRVGVMIACILLLDACGHGAPPDRLAIGQMVPAFSLLTLSGQPLSPADYRGKVVILNLWATWCAPCRRELPSLQRLSQRLDAQRFVVLGVTLDQDDRLVREYLTDKGVTYTNLIDHDMAVAKQTLGLSAYPDTLVIGPDGRLVGRVAGALQWDTEQVVEAVEAAYQGRGELLEALPRAAKAIMKSS